MHSSLGLVLGLAQAFGFAQTPGGEGGGGVLTTMGELVLQGGLLMIPIALCSVVSIGLAIERFLALRQSKIAPANLWSEVESALKKNNVAGARDRVASGDLPLTRMLHAGLLHWEDGLQDVASALEDAGQREADDMEKHLPALQGIVSVAPLLGLLGTVVGMIQSFLTVAEQRALGNPELLAKGIGQALVTTAAGLTVAIPALVLYYIFRGRIGNLVRELDDVARGVLALHRRGG